MTGKTKLALFVGAPVALLFAIACGAGSGADYGDAPRNADTVASAEATKPPVAPATPVTVTGKGESVKTVELVAASYTLTYSADSIALIVTPVQSNGAEDRSVVNALSADWDTRKVSGTTIFRASGPTTFHVHNTTAAWTLTFTPLS